MKILKNILKFILLLVLCVFVFIFLSLDFFNVFLGLAYILFIFTNFSELIKIFNEKVNRKHLKFPIVFDKNNDMYIIFNKPKIIIYLISTFLGCFIFALIGVSYDYFMLWFILFVSIISNFGNNVNMLLLKKNNYLYNVINGNNNKYKVLKVNKVSKVYVGCYIFDFSNYTSSRYYLEKDYIDYDELINLIELRVKSNSKNNI